MATPREQVLGTTELLENVLVFLPMRTLLHAQRVCHTWQDVITQSLTLQQALFFRARESKKNENDEDAANEIEMNPLLEWLFPTSIRLEDSRWRFQFMSPSYEMNDFETIWWNDDDYTMFSVLRATASWRKMLPVQPPPKSLNLEIWYYAGMLDIADYSCATADGFIPIKDGLRMGRLYDYIDKEWRGFGPRTYCLLFSGL